MAWIFFGFESAADVAEEVVHPGRHVPRAMISSLLGAGVVTAIVVAALILGASDLEAAAADPAQTIPLHPGRALRPGRPAPARGPGGLRVLLVRGRHPGRRRPPRLLVRPRRPGARAPRGCGRSRATASPRGRSCSRPPCGAIVTAATYVDVGALNANALLVSYAVAGIYVSFQAVILARLLAARPAAGARRASSASAAGARRPRGARSSTAC